MKKIALAFVFITLVTGTFAQTIFTYGKNAVSKEEFLRAFYKNPAATPDRATALKEYLNLYINFKLKVQAALDAGLDKDATQQFELENFKKQIADNIINEEANVKALVKEALERSQKEIKLQQVFIEVPPGADTADAFKKIQAAYKQLKDGKDFSAVVEEFSNDAGTQQSKGDLGFITAFTLPYDLETTIYNLKVNSFSSPVRSKVGYHIFKNVGERKSSGSRRVAQILVAIPPNSTAEDKTTASRKADSLYRLLTSGTDFASLAAASSNDQSSSNNRGELPEFTIGTYDAVFEEAAFSLKKPGDISKPFQTEYGFHILKLLEAKQTANDPTDQASMALLQEKVVRDNRLELSKKALIPKKLALIKFKPSLIKLDDLYAFTDSAVRKNKVAVVKGITAGTPIFSFAGQNVKATNWINYAKSNGNTSYLNNKESYKELYKNFINSQADQYYRDHLDTYNRDYAIQVKEFKDANLLFGVMEKNVWGKANSDTAGLMQYFKQHKSKYNWAVSADAIIVTCNNESVVSEMQKKLKENYADWRAITSNRGTDVSADSGRFELGQLPVVERTNFTTGLITAPVKNQNDGTYIFNYMVRVYNEPAPRSFEDARGMVISDYQQVLEDNWIVELKKKYPVKVNQAVFQSIK